MISRPTKSFAAIRNVPVLVRAGSFRALASDPVAPGSVTISPRSRSCANLDTSKRLSLVHGMFVSTDGTPEGVSFRLQDRLMIEDRLYRRSQPALLHSFRIGRVLNIAVILQ